MARFVQEAEMIVINSAAHDCVRSSPDTVDLEHYAQTLNDSIDRTRFLNPKARLWYKGSNLETLNMPGCGDLDVVAQEVARTQRIDFMDITKTVRPLYEAIPELHLVGTHVGAIHIFLCQEAQDVNCGGLVAKLQLYDLLTHLCSDVI